METVGFIGLGAMGGPVAGHIQRAGYPMVVYDLREDATRSFREGGATVVDSAAALARKSDVIITALPMPVDVEQVACGKDGIIEGIRPGSVFVDISTSPPSLIRRLEPLFRSQGRIGSGCSRSFRATGRRPWNPRSHGGRRARDL